MYPALHNDITNRLVRDYGFKERTGWLRAGVCPACSKKELYTNAEKPWVLNCGRLNHCGWQGHIKELYPDAFEQFNERFKATDENPNATADAYMAQARGLDITRIRGWYEQGRWWSPDAVGNKGTATVRFVIEPGVYFERFVETVWVMDDGEKKPRKSHFHGKFQGSAWFPPGQKIEAGDDVWVVEGILDAIALYLNGIKACAALSSSNYPGKFMAEYQGMNVRWVWALDGDRAGRKATIKHHQAARAAGHNSSAVTVLQGRLKEDWNDLHMAGRLDDKSIEEYRYQGSLLIAESASEKAMLMYGKTARREFPFEFKNRFYWFGLNLDKYQKAVERMETADTGATDDQIREAALKESGALAEMANCYFRFLYFQANAITDESWYYCRVTFPHGGAPVKNTFTGGQLSSASEFKKRLLSIAAGSVFTGSSQQLDIIAKDQLYNIKTVNTLDFVGYSKEYGIYVFNDIAVKDGRIYPINDEDYFDAGKLAVKSINQSVTLHIARDDHNNRTDWVNHIRTCFGAGGLVALAFWFGSLFAEQIRDRHKTFPFLEIVGEPGAGKSTLIEFLWKLVGRRDYEGFDPSKSTLAARARNMSQVANLPIVLIEADRGDDTAHAKKFDWDELKTAYNGRSVRSRGAKNSGNETYEPPFRGTIVISQNADVDASEAILQRIVHLKFTRQDHTEDSKELAQELEQMPLEQVSRFLIDAAKKETEVLKTVFELAPQFERSLLGRPGVKNVRIAKNHAQMCALVSAMALVLPIDESTVKTVHTHIAKMAEQRQVAISADHPLVQEFWELYDYLNASETAIPRLNHSRDDDTIAINLNHLVKVASDHRQQMPPLSELKRLLKTSRRHKFLRQAAVNSRIEMHDGVGKTVRCWIFEARDRSGDRA